MTAPVYIVVNGINNRPGSAHGLTDRAVTWLIERGLLAEKFEYFSTGIGFRWLTQPGHVDDLVELIDSHKSRPICLVGHSNGCDLIVKAVQQCQARAMVLNLFSPACNADFEKNGLNDALGTSGKVETVSVYVAGKDEAMRWARLSQIIFGKFGYGSLGLNGPTNVNPDVAPFVHVHREPTYGHSTWFDSSNFDKTMKQLLTTTQTQ